MPGWVATGSMNVGRRVKSAAVLADGRVLVAGGRSQDGAAAVSSEIYNPETGIWTQTGSLNQPHEDSYVVALPDGDAVVVGNSFVWQADALMERWNRHTGEWSATTMPPFMSAVEGAWVDGDDLLVLCTPTERLAEMEFRSVNMHGGQVEQLPSPILPRHFAMNARLADARILLTGGIRFGIASSGTVEFLTTECEVYDHGTRAWLPVANLHQPHMSLDRTWQYLVPLLDGGALMVAGSNHLATYLELVEHWSQTTGQWGIAQPLGPERDGHVATLLSDGSVVVVGGEGPDGVRSDCHIYDIAADAWTEIDTLTSPRTLSVAVTLPDESVLVLGGAGTQGTCELYF